MTHTFLYHSILYKAWFHFSSFQLVAICCKQTACNKKLVAQCVHAPVSLLTTQLFGSSLCLSLFFILQTYSTRDFTNVSQWFFPFQFIVVVKKKIFSRRRDQKSSFPMVSFWNAWFKKYEMDNQIKVKRALWFYHFWSTNDHYSSTNMDAPHATCNNNWMHQQVPYK